MAHSEVNIIDAMRDPALFGPWFRGDSWITWLVFLKALFDLPLEDAKLETYARFTGRNRVPERFSEAWLVVGRRAGKSLIAALIAVFLACFRAYTEHLGPGERVTIMVIAADRRQARVVMRYVMGFLENVPMLADLIERRTRETIDLTNRVTIEIHTASFRTIRGYTIGAVIADEIAFWRSEESASPDREIINAVRPGMSTIPGSLLIAISSPYARRGMLWETYQRHFGKEGQILVWQAPTQAMNPLISDAVIKAALDEDESSARAEYFAEFRRDIEGFVSRESVDTCVVGGRNLLAPVTNIRYFAFVDPSGGSQDSMTLAVAHAEGKKAILDLLLERKPPFSPEAVVAEFAATLKQYSVSKVHGDRYGGEWPREQFRKLGIDYKSAEKAKSELYLGLLPLLNSGRVELLDHPRLIAQLANLERRTSRSGRDSIDHAPGAHDDLANAAAGAIDLASCRSGELHFISPAQLIRPSRGDAEEQVKVRDFFSESLNQNRFDF